MAIEQQPSIVSNPFRDPTSPTPSGISDLSQPSSLMAPAPVPAAADAFSFGGAPAMPAATFAPAPVAVP